MSTIVPDELLPDLRILATWKDQGRCLICDLLDSERWLLAWTKLRVRLHCGGEPWDAIDPCPLCGSSESDRQFITCMKCQLEVLVTVLAGGGMTDTEGE